MQFRSLYNTLQPQARNFLARRIFNTYLKPSADHSIQWPQICSDTVPISLVIDVVRYSIENLDANIFDDISFLSLQAMEQLYTGKFKYQDGQKGRDPIPFRSSVCFNIMCSDLRMKLVNHR